MSRRARRTRARSRVIRLDPADLVDVAGLTAVGQLAREAGMKLISANAYPCQDGTFSIRLVWRQRSPIQVSMAETIRGVRLQ